MHNYWSLTLICIFNQGTTPVYFAAQEGRLQALQYLHDSANCDLMKASEDGLKPIHAACQTGHTSIVKVYRHE